MQSVHVQNLAHEVEGFDCVVVELAFGSTHAPSFEQQRGAG